MFVPLRWIRETPRHLLVCERSHVRHERSRHAARVRDHAFNCRVSFLIPDCGIPPEALKSAVADAGKYYLLKNLSLHELVTQEFINNFVKKGSCYALTYNTRIDQDNSAALLPTGKLIISVDKDTYEELGLQGRPSLYSGKKPMRYIVTIDLTDSTFNPDSKKHKRVIWALREKKPLEFDFLLAWHHKGSEESTLMSYFSKNQIQAHQPKIIFSTLRNVQCPVLEYNKLQGEPESACSAQEFFEWLGAILNHVDLDNTSSNFLSTYSCPQPNTVVEQALLCTITGFIIPEKIIQLLEQIWTALWLHHHWKVEWDWAFNHILNSFIDIDGDFKVLSLGMVVPKPLNASEISYYFEEPKLAHWISLIVHGFADSPVSWRESEHGFLKGGENLYNFVIFRSLDYWLQMAVGAYDDCP